VAQALRHQVVDANQRIIEDVVAVAIAGAAAGVEDDGATGLEGATLIELDDRADGFVTDPQGIARPWEPNK
jgi:hypothetical protein